MGDDWNLILLKDIHIVYFYYCGFIIIIYTMSIIKVFRIYLALWTGACRAEVRQKPNALADALTHKHT